MDRLRGEEAPAAVDDIRVLVSIGGPLTVSQIAAAIGAEPDDVLAACDDL